MEVQSKVKGAINDYLRTVTFIGRRVCKDKDILEFRSKAKNIFVDTSTGASSTTLNGLKSARTKQIINKNKECDIISIRDSVQVALSDRENNTTLFIGQLVAVANYIEDNNIKVFKGYEGYEANHIDFSGNEVTRGFTNNRAFNLELVEENQNSRHKEAEIRLHKLFGKYLGISAADDELIDKILCGDAGEIESYINLILNTVEIDTYNTVKTPFLGKAGLMLREYKAKHNKVIIPYNETIYEEV